MSTPTLPNFRKGTRGWDYRIVRHYFAEDHDQPTYTYAIHEVHYADGEILAISSEPVRPEAEDYQWMIEKFMEAAKKPVLDFETRQEIR